MKRSEFFSLLGLGSLAGLVSGMGAKQAGATPTGNIVETFASEPGPIGLPRSVAEKPIDDLRAMYPSATTEMLPASGVVVPRSVSTCNSTDCVRYTVDCSGAPPLPWVGTSDGERWVVIADGDDVSGMIEFRGVSNVPFPQVTMEYPAP
jgi:hypothetical protein